MLKAANRHNEEIIAALKERILFLERLLFGSKSEKVEHGNLDIVIEQVDQDLPPAQPDTTTQKAQKKKKYKPHLKICFKSKEIEVLILKRW